MSNLKTSKFIPLFVTQAAGAFNDNLFKSALMVSISFSIISIQGVSKETLLQIANALFILPFLFASAISGQIADKFEKSMLILSLKVFEVGLSVVGAIAIATQNPHICLFVLFGLGLQATLFGPLKYSIIPQHVEPSELITANSYIEAGTFISILAGSIIGGVLHANAYFPYLLIIASLIGLYSAFKIPFAQAGDPELKINFNIFTATTAVVKSATKQLAVYRGLLAISWFWFLGASLLSVFPLITSDYLKADERIFTIFLSLFSVGVAIGSLVCEKLAQNRVEIGLVPVGALGMAIFGFLFASSLSHSVIVNTKELSFIELILNKNYQFIYCSLFGMSFFGGLFIVPLYTLIQQRVEKKIASQTIAANNVLNGLFMVLSSLFAFLCHKVGLSLIEYLYAVFIIHSLICLYIFYTVPEFFFRFLAWALVNTFYRVKVKGSNNIPENNGALLICNHVSFLDALLLFGACHRPAKFIMYYKIYNIPFLKPIFKAVGAVPIASKTEDPLVLENAYSEIKKSLSSGEILVIFPEGGITHDGKLQEFKPGMLKILQTHNVPVIPCALTGLWGSMYSRKEKSILRFVPKSIFSRSINLEIGQPLHFKNQPDFLQQSRDAVKNLLNEK